MAETQSAPGSTGLRKARETAVGALLARIAEGSPGEGEPLPPLATLARELEADEAALRAAVDQLARWGVLERRGGGLRVRERRRWSFHVLAHLVPHHPIEGGPPMATLVHDLLGILRPLVLHSATMASRRVAPGDLDRAREALALAWEARDDPPLFAARHVEMIRHMLEAASMYPLLWLANDMGPVFEKLAAGVGTRAPENYVAIGNELFEAIERGSPDDAARVVEHYIHDVDRVFLAGLRRGD